MSAELPPHAGTVLMAALEAMGLTQAQLSRRISVSEKHLSQIRLGKAGIGVALAVSLEDVTGVPAETWLAAQARRDVAVERQARAARDDSEDAQRRAVAAVQRLTEGSQ